MSRKLVVTSDSGKHLDQLFTIDLVFSGADGTLVCMTTALHVRKDASVNNETAWARLHRIATARREFLHLSQAQIAAAGGPSVAWQTKLRHKTETPGVRHRAYLESLDAVLLWDTGTSMRLLTQDRSGWSAETLADEEFRLIEGKDRIGHFAFMVEQRLRSLDPKDSEMMIRRIALTMGLPVVGG